MGFVLRRQQLQKSHKFHLVKPCPVRGMELVLNFHGSALAVWYNSSLVSFIPRSRNGTFKKQHILTRLWGPRAAPAPLGSPPDLSRHFLPSGSAPNKENGAGVFPWRDGVICYTAQRWKWWGKHDTANRPKQASARLFIFRRVSLVSLTHLTLLKCL